VFLDKNKAADYQIRDQPTMQAIFAGQDVTGCRRTFEAPQSTWIALITASFLKWLLSAPLII